jgi:hypothetical protein
MVEDNLSRLEVSNGQARIHSTFWSGREISLVPWGNLHYDVFENGELVGMICADEIVEFIQSKNE